MKPATELPWETMRERGRTICGGEGDDYRVICEIRDFPEVEEEIADAAYLVHACNAYPRLVEALRQYVEVVSSVNDPNDFSVKVKDEGHHARDLLIDLGEYQ